MSRTITCRDCRKDFPAPTGRGRPPVRCEDCNAAKATAVSSKPSTPASERLAKARAARKEVKPAKAKDAKPSRTHIPVGRQAQCTTCWRIFSSDSVCERHKKYATPKTKDCKAPESLGLVAVLKSGVPVWVSP